MSCDDPAVRKLKQNLFNAIQFLDFAHLSLFKEDKFGTQRFRDSLCLRSRYLVADTID